MVLYIDHYDSFSAILIDYFKQLDQKIVCVKTDEIKSIKNINLFDHIVLGPGPGHPKELQHIFSTITDVIALTIPVLGICLGHQLLAYYFGSKVIHSSFIMHGQCSQIIHNNNILYKDVPQKFLVTRYHSLIVDKSNISDELIVTGHTNCVRKEVMSFAHKSYPIFGIQYHPEAYLTEHGLLLLSNFLRHNKSRK